LISVKKPVSTREKLLLLSRSYTFANAIVLAPVTIAICLGLLFSLAFGGLSGPWTMFSLHFPQVWWAILWLASLFVWWSHADWRAALLSGGSLPHGSTTLWLGSVLVNGLSMASYLLVMMDSTLNGPRLRYAELHAVVLLLPSWALLMALVGLGMTVRVRKTQLPKGFSKFTPGISQRHR
jgi:hypothetical protein